MSKELKLSKGALSALSALRNFGEPATAHALKAKGLKGLNPAHLTALVNGGLATAVKVKLVCGGCGAKRMVNEYTLTELGQTYKAE